MRKRDAKPLPDRAFLFECLRYEDGMLFWLERPARHFSTNKKCSVFNAMWARKQAGSLMKNGYRIICIDQEKFLEHRLIYHMMVEEIDPSVFVDHRNWDHSNNRFENLRAASKSQNGMNSPARRRKKEFLPKHVYWSEREQKYKVALRASGRRMNFGTFALLEDAEQAADRARKQHHGEFSRAA